jgi:hypothetical protein
MTSRSSQYGTEVSRLGTDRSSMETLFLTCLQANFIIGRVISHPELTVPQKNDIVWEIKQVTKKGCFLDAKAD